MVVIVDLNDEGDVDPAFHRTGAHNLQVDPVSPVKLNSLRHRPSSPIQRELFENAVTRAFAQYPIVESVVRHIDLNTLDSLSRTSHLIHDGLVQYRSSLLKTTLHCVNHDAPVDPNSTLRFRARAGNLYFDNNSRGGAHTPYNGKSGECARDLVSECRKCGVPVCRNCTIKRPGNNVLKERLRRLCVACVEAPLVTLLGLPLPLDTPYTQDDIQRHLCQCNQRAGVWLCQPCGRGIRTSDSDYIRIWRWRLQYGEVLGGLGTGIGDGDRGVICGREADCIAAKEVEQETDCDAEDARDDYMGAGSSSEGHTPSDGPVTPLHWHNNSGILTGESRTPSPLQLGPGYERHEIEGIGGVVKRKLVRMVRVGACVPEWEDEKSNFEIMRKERLGEARSLCGWCCKVVPGQADRSDSSL